jgi:hypothetical protein
VTLTRWNFSSGETTKKWIESKFRNVKMSKVTEEKYDSWSEAGKTYNFCLNGRYETTLTAYHFRGRERSVFSSQQFPSFCSV